MGKLTFVWLGLYFGGLVGAVIHPIYPMVSYLVYYFAPPQFHWWGKVIPDLRFSLLASAVVLVSLIVHGSGLEGARNEGNRALKWLGTYTLNTSLVTAWAINRSLSWFYSVVVWKLLILYLLIPAAVRTPAHFDVFGKACVVGAAWWGYKTWENPRRSAGRLEAIIGGPDSKQDNGAAGVLVMVIPFAALYTLTGRSKFQRLLAGVAGALIVNVFILCNSRGATLGLIAGVLTGLVLAGRRRRLKLIRVAVAGAVAVLLLADPEFIERQKTTADPQDGSAQSRLELWAAGLALVNDYPAGAGGYAYHILSSKYAPDVVARSGYDERSAHNTYVQMAAEWGVQGIVLYAIFMVTTIRMLHAVRKRGKDSDWYYYRALVLEVSLVGISVAALFTNHVYSESIYWMCALSFALYRIQATDLSLAAAPSATVGTLATDPPTVPLPRYDGLAGVDPAGAGAAR